MDDIRRFFPDVGESLNGKFCGRFGECAGVAVSCSS